MLSIELARIRQRHPHAAPELRFGLYTVRTAPRCQQPRIDSAGAY